jgi:hypothetical protein
MKGDSYWHGRHFWVHFWCGLVIGGFLGARISSGLFESPWASIGLTFIVALLFASAVGYWGDPLWRRLLEIWRGF